MSVGSNQVESTDVFFTFLDEETWTWRMTALEGMQSSCWIMHMHHTGTMFLVLSQPEPADPLLTGNLWFCFEEKHLGMKRKTV